MPSPTQHKVLTDIQGLSVSCPACGHNCDTFTIENIKGEPCITTQCCQAPVDNHPNIRRRYEHFGLHHSSFENQTTRVILPTLPTEPDGKPVVDAHSVGLIMHAYMMAGETFTLDDIRTHLKQGNRNKVQKYMDAGRKYAGTLFQHGQIEKDLEDEFPPEAFRAIRDIFKKTAERQMADRMEQIQQKEDDLIAEQNTFRTTKSELIETKTKLEGQIEELRKAKGEVDNELETVRESKRHELNALQEKISELTNQNGQLDAKLDAESDERKRVQGELQKTKELLDAQVDLVTSLESARDAFIKTAAEHGTTIKELRLRLRDEAEAAQKRESDWVTKLDASEKAMTKQSEVLSVIQTQLEHAHLESERLTTEQERLTDERNQYKQMADESAIKIDMVSEQLKDQVQQFHEQLTKLQSRNIQLERNNGVMQAELNRLGKKPDSLSFE